jgi:putative membrane protein
MMGSGLVLLLVIVGAIAYALGWRPQFNQTGRAQNSETPLETLKARYARGEISREEYELMRRDLEA